jgi:hypothetical protein
MSNDQPALSQDRNGLFTIFLVLVLLSCWLIVFTIGSQLKHSAQTLYFMKFLTSQEPNMIILGCLGSALGVIRRRSLKSIDNLAFPDFISGIISGFATSIMVSAFPLYFSSLSGAFKPDQNTYIPFSLFSSYLAFISGYDKNFFDRATQLLLNKLGILKK